MSFSLGLDTGGTYTDAVVFDNTQNIVTAKAKSLTTRHNLAIGIAGAAAQVLERSGVTARDISLVSISTTLATNSLVEGFAANRFDHIFQPPLLIWICKACQCCR